MNIIESLEMSEIWEFKSDEKIVQCRSADLVEVVAYR